MPEYKPDIIKLIDSIEPIREAIPVCELAGGPASSTWLLELREQKFTLRLDKPIVQSLGLDRLSEISILQSVADAGIGPEVIWADPANGVLVCRYLEGSAWCRQDTQDILRLQELAQTLRKLHRLTPCGPVFDPAGAAWRYAREIGTGVADDLAQTVSLLVAELSVESHEKTLCHNDLVHSNIIGSGPVQLIDWEYAAVGDPFFDLAIVTRHHDLNEKLAGHFLQAYLGGPLGGQQARFTAYCRLYDHLCALWYLSMAKTCGSEFALDDELNQALIRLTAA